MVFQKMKNVRSTYKTLAFMASGAKEDQDQGVHGAFKKTRIQG